MSIIVVSGTTEFLGWDRHSSAVVEPGIIQPTPDKY